MNIRSLVFTALFAALFIVFSAIKIPLGISPVPITLQNFALMLAGGILGARYGGLSVLLVVALTATGLPLLHGEGGLSLILGRTGGFILSFPICAFLVGWFTQKWLRSSLAAKGKAITAVGLFLVFYLFGSLASYLLGVPWLAQAANISMEKAIVNGFYLFIPGDLAKAALAAIVVTALLPYLPKSLRIQPRSQAPGHGQAHI